MVTDAEKMVLALLVRENGMLPGVAAALAEVDRIVAENPAASGPELLIRLSDHYDASGAIG